MTTVQNLYRICQLCVVGSCVFHELTIILFLIFHLFAQYTIRHKAGIFVYIFHVSNTYSVYEDTNLLNFKYFNTGQHISDTFLQLLHL